MFFVPFTLFDAPSPARDSEWTHEESPREILELDDAAIELDPQDVRKAYLRMSVRAHPDKPGGSQEAFTKVNDAYRWLQAEADSSIDMHDVMREASKILEEFHVFHEILGQTVPPQTERPKVESAELVTTPAACVRGDATATTTLPSGRTVCTPVPPGTTHGDVLPGHDGAEIRVRVRPARHRVHVRCGGRDRVADGVMHVRGRDVHIDFAIGLTEVILGFEIRTRTPDGLHDCAAVWPPWSEPARRAVPATGVPAFGGGSDVGRGSLVMQPRIRPSVDRAPMADFVTAFEKIIERVYTRTRS